MGTRWGINRSVAQVHALLFVSERPFMPKEIAETLDVARSSISVEESTRRPVVKWPSKL